MKTIECLGEIKFYFIEGIFPSIHVRSLSIFQSFFILFNIFPINFHQREEKNNV